jgi:lipopolysaccharide export LptBFGC system permease protein LptF
MAYLLVFRHQRRALPIAVAAMVILSTILDGAQHMYPAALAGSLTGAVLVAASAWIWIRGTMKDTLAESHPAS